VGFHVHYFLLAEMLEAMIDAIAKVEALEPQHRARLKDVAQRWQRL
jgi:hypothetical protein